MSVDPIRIPWKMRERRGRGRDGWQTSGGVVLDVGTGKLLLVKNRRERREGRSGWTWPKGRIDPFEGPVFAALREIKEEAGVLAEPLSRIALLETRRALRHYFLLLKIDGGKKLHRETLEVRWVRPGKAKRLLERQRDQLVLQAATSTIEAMRKNKRPDSWPQLWAA